MLFLVVLFLLKTNLIFKNTEVYQKTNDSNELIYTNATIEDLVNKDTDNDKIPDWQESLYGLDPTKKETTPGTPDNVAIEKLRAQEDGGIKTTDENGNIQTAEKLTETEKLSRELFATIAAANQNGIVDETTIDSLSTALVEKIKNPVIRKVFSVSDIKTTKDDSSQAVKIYFDTMNGVQAKYPVKDEESVVNVLTKFVADENNVDSSILLKLDPAIKQTQNIINGILKVPVPQSLVTLHLNFLNAGERMVENVIDMKLFDDDPILSMGAMIKYQDNWTSFQTAFEALINAINTKLNN